MLVEILTTILVVGLVVGGVSIPFLFLFRHADPKIGDIRVIKYGNGDYEIQKMVEGATGVQWITVSCRYKSIIKTNEKIKLIKKQLLQAAKQRANQKFTVVKLIDRDGVRT